MKRNGKEDEGRDRAKGQKMRERKGNRNGKEDEERERQRR